MTPQVPAPQPPHPVFTRTVFNGATIGVQRGPNDMRIISVWLPNGTEYQIPLDPDSAKEIGMKLTAPGIVPARSNGSQSGGQG